MKVGQALTVWHNKWLETEDPGHVVCPHCDEDYFCSCQEEAEADHYV